LDQLRRIVKAGIKQAGRIRIIGIACGSRSSDEHGKIGGSRRRIPDQRLKTFPFIEFPPGPDFIQQSVGLRKSGLKNGKTNKNSSSQIFSYDEVIAEKILKRTTGKV